MVKANISIGEFVGKSIFTLLMVMCRQYWMELENPGRHATVLFGSLFYPKNKEVLDIKNEEGGFNRFF